MGRSGKAVKYLFAAVYVLVLATQLPHVWSAYASIEAPGLELAQWTALGAAVAFELSTGVFTYRIVKGSRRRWTKRGLWFFIAASICANGQYYNLLPVAFAVIWPLFATVALPLALALFAEEFGAEVKKEARKAKRKPDDMPMTTTDTITIADDEQVTFTTKTEQVRRLHGARPELSMTQLAQEIGCSASTVTRALNRKGGE